MGHVRNKLEQDCLPTRVFRITQIGPRDHENRCDANQSPAFDESDGRLLHKPCEWFLVPLPVIDQNVERIRDQSITRYSLAPKKAALVPHGTIRAEAYLAAILLTPTLTVADWFLALNEATRVRH